jgi:hypothetical protein
LLPPAKTETAEKSNTAANAKAMGFLILFLQMENIGIGDKFVPNTPV